MLLLVLLLVLLAARGAHGGDFESLSIQRAHSLRAHIIEDATAHLPKLRVLFSKPSHDDTALDVGVAWTNVGYTSPADWVGVFTCASATDSNCSPQGRYPIQFKRPHAPRKEGALNFTVLVRPGAPAFMFAYVSPAVTPYPEVIAMSALLPVPETLLRRPMQLRISRVAEDASALRVIFTMPASTPQADLQAMRVRFYSADKTTVIATAAVEAAYTFDARDLCEPAQMPAATMGYLRPGLQALAIARGLPADADLPYEVLHGSGKVLRTGRARTAPSAGARTVLAVFGDMGQSMTALDGSQQHSWDFRGRGEIGAINTTRLLRALLDDDSLPLSLVAHIGDISYATGLLALWDSFLDQVEPVSARVPYMTAMGNHEMGFAGSAIPGSDSQGECGVPYATYFPFAGQQLQLDDAQTFVRRARGARDAPWYSFAHGLVHVSVISTEHELAPDGAQLRWLERDLARVDRRRTPWVVVMGHRPMYVSSDWIGDHDALARTLQEFVEPLAVAHGVDAMFFGHHHSYQRSCRFLRGNACVQGSGGGVQHFVVGAGGFAFSELPRVRDENFEFTENKQWGLAVVDVRNSSHAHVAFRASRDGAVIDEIWLVREMQHEPLL